MHHIYTTETLTGLALLLALFFAPVASASENPHCTSESRNGNIVTQCDDGTVTVVGSRGTATVCRTSMARVTCEAFKT